MKNLPKYGHTGNSKLFELIRKAKFHRCLQYYYGSQLIEKILPDKSRLIFQLVDRDDNNNIKRYLVYKTYIKSINRFLKKHLTLRELLLSSIYDVCYLVDYQDKKIIDVRGCYHRWLPENYLPKYESWYDPMPHP